MTGKGLRTDEKMRLALSYLFIVFLIAFFLYVCITNVYILYFVATINIASASFLVFAFSREFFKIYSNKKH